MCDKHEDHEIISSVFVAYFLASTILFLKIILDGPEMNKKSYFKGMECEIKKRVRCEGFVLLKDTGIISPQDLQDNMKFFIDEPMEYFAGSAERHKITKNIFTTNKKPADKILPPHQEMSYARKFPKTIVFGCSQKATKGGDSILVDMVRLTDMLSIALLTKFLSRNFRIKLFFKSSNSKYDGLPILTWNDAFLVDNPMEAENSAIAEGYHVEWELNKNIMSLEHHVPGYLYHQSLDKKVIFNSVYPNCISKKFNDELLSEYPFLEDYGYHWDDDSRLSEEEITELKQAYEKCSSKFLLEKGDVLVINNLLTSHGRLPYQGDRRINVLLGDPLNWKSDVY